MTTSQADTRGIVLIIDDQPANLALLVDYLEKNKIEVVVAENGQNGIARAKYVSPDLILLDVMMPGMDGFDTCRQLKNDRQTGDIPIIFMTALTGLDDVLKAFESGGVDYLTKPIQLDEVWARINAHLTIKRLRNDLEEKNRLLQEEVAQRLKIEEDLRQHRDFLRTVIDALPHPFYVINAENYEVVLANTRAAAEGQWQGKTCYEIYHLSDKPCEGSAHPCPLEEVRATGQAVICEHIHGNSRGQQSWVEVHASPILSKEGKVIQLIEYSLDISERKLLEEHLRKRAITDELTGLYNRRGFFLLTEKYLQISARQHCSLYLLYADLNNMKWTNDTFGHQAGDELLVETARLLQDTFRQSDVIGRMGGDEFAVLLQDNNNEYNEETICRRFYDKVGARNHSKAGYELSISIGVARYDPLAPATFDELLSRADALMYACKERMKKER
ncbi:diguanylate cyclase [Desulfogranum mediterraneum]|uniref:diguanylate cyclase n=1 Tax=Desulfogranum mediterraneum TaxID=160661 RepID=UPI000419BF11|nr:diguanylate cyclase [Desulfogranum mediterraneum]